jgi:hypothetical protein
MGFILFLISLILTSVFFAVSLVFNPIYYLLSFKWKSGLKHLDSYFRRLAVSIDQFGNGATSEILNKALLKREEKYLPSPYTFQKKPKESVPLLDIFSLPFGNMDLTVSYVIGVNKYLNNLSRTGRAIERLLNLIEKEHVEKALENQFKSDEEARKRLVRAFVYYHR